MKKMEIIKIKNLTKIFDKKRIIDSVSLSIKKGEIFGILGPNGAGKSTLISMISTLLIPTEGDLIIKGYNAKKDGAKIREKINVVFQDFLMDDDLNAYENLDFYARIYKIKKEDRENKIKEVLNFSGIDPKNKHRVSKFSGGMKKRLEIARGILNNPDILILDEPTEGLDALIRRDVISYLKKINMEKSTTILISTHNLIEAEKLCDRVAIMNKGKIIALGKPKEIIKKIKKNSSLEEAFIKLIK